MLEESVMPYFLVLLVMIAGKLILICSIRIIFFLSLRIKQLITKLPDWFELAFFVHSLTSLSTNMDKRGMMKKG